MPFFPIHLTKFYRSKKLSDKLPQIKVNQISMTNKIMSSPISPQKNLDDLHEVVKKGRNAPSTLLDFGYEDNNHFLEFLNGKTNWKLIADSVLHKKEPPKTPVFQVIL